MQMFLQKIKKVIRNPFIPFSYLWVTISPIIKSSEKFLRVYYRLRTGKRLNLEHPVSFQEKTQWLKLHDTDPMYSQLVDKYAVRGYVAERIGEDHLIPLLGVYDSFEDIDFWIGEYKSQCSQNAKLFLVGNKIGINEYE